ncbi:MAG: oligosaccharide flippase family protein [Bacteroidia bacterium]|nr:oligosaccharide flippase family protein [Bacteroidia bacterium]
MPKSPFISSLVLTALGFIPALAGIFLLPLYLNQLSSEEYAIMNLVIIFAGFAAMLGNLKLDAAMRTFYFDYEQEPEKLNNYLSQIFSFGLILLIFFFGLMLIIGPFLFGFIFRSEALSFYPFGFYALAASFLSLAKSPYMIFLKNQIRLKEFAFYNLGEFSLIFALQAYFILVLGKGVEGALLGSLIAQAFIFLLFFLLNFRLLKWKIELDFLRPSLRYSLGIIPFILMNWMIIRGDRILFEQFSELKEVGKYALLMAILGFSRILLNAMDNAIRPFLFSRLKAGDAESLKEAHILLRYYVAVSCLFLSAILMLSAFLPLLTDKTDFLEVIPYFSWGALALLPGILIRVYNLQLVFVKKAYEISSLGFLNLIVLLAGFYFWVPAHGIMGAIASIAASNLLSLLLFAYRSNVYRSADIPAFPALDILLISGAIFLIASSWEVLEWRFRSPLQFALLLSLILFLFRKQWRMLFQMKEGLQKS